MIGKLITQFTTNNLRKKAVINQTSKNDKNVEQFLKKNPLERLQQKTIIQESF